MRFDSQPKNFEQGIPLFFVQDSESILKKHNLQKQPRHTQIINTNSPENTLLESIVELPGDTLSKITTPFYDTFKDIPQQVTPLKPTTFQETLMTSKQVENPIKVQKTNADNDEDMELKVRMDKPLRKVLKEKKATLKKQSPKLKEDMQEKSTSQKQSNENTSMYNQEVSFHIPTSQLKVLSKQKMENAVLKVTRELGIDPQKIVIFGMAAR